MTTKVTVIDYGIGNLFSIGNALKFCNADMVLTSDPVLIAQADRLILPGVGAFKDGIKGLEKRTITGAVLEFCEKGRPFLGICLGMQMMLDWSEEFGLHQGLSIIPGRVVPIPFTADNGTPHKVPHISWSPLVHPEHEQDWAGTLLDGIQAGSCCYFVHSYHCKPEKAHFHFADTLYNGRRLAAVIHKDQLYGCQFHPEKSGKLGLQILQNFIRL